MASILSVCTDILGNAKLSLNSFYWDLKLTFAKIGCKVGLCMTDTDSVLHQLSKVTKYIHGSGHLEKELMEKHFSANSGINSLLHSHNFPNESTHYKSDHKNVLLRFGFEIVPPRTVEKFIGRASKQCVVQIDDSDISKRKE